MAASARRPGRAGLRPRLRPPGSTAAVAVAIGTAASSVIVTRADERRLKIRNGCDREPIWIAHEAGGGIGPDLQNVRIDPGQLVEFGTPAGLSATRYWPKMGCDDTGANCVLGGSGGPGEGCQHNGDYSGCAPPVDTKFEGTFGSAALSCTPADAKGCDYVDMSLVDGWTLPFELKLQGECTGSKGVQNDMVIDCRGLTFDQCPHQEVLTANFGQVADLRARNPFTKQVAGCYSPCQRLIDNKWGNTGGNVLSPQAVPYCCPTPPESPEMCRSGPIVQTSFLQVVHSRCPGVYGYAYDDGMGLLRCTPWTVYELTFFCPDGTTNFQVGKRAAEEKAEAERKRAEAKRAEEQAVSDKSVAEALSSRQSASDGRPPSSSDASLQNKGPHALRAEQPQSDSPTEYTRIQAKDEVFGPAIESIGERFQPAWRAAGIAGIVTGVVMAAWVWRRLPRVGAALVATEDMPARLPAARDLEGRAAPFAGACGYTSLGPGSDIGSPQA